MQLPASASRPTKPSPNDDKTSPTLVVAPSILWYATTAHEQDRGASLVRWRDHAIPDTDLGTQGLLFGVVSESQRANDMPATSLHHSQMTSVAGWFIGRGVLLSHGQTLGRYTLVEQLAIGGMAEIWLAHLAGPEGFEKVVVIKKIRPHLANQKNFLNMFLNEARLAAHLNHPNIVQIHEFGNPDNQHYIAMEYIFGRDLSEIVPKAKQADIPFPVEYAIKIIAQVCEGLYYAHTKAEPNGKPLKIIHRDISPQNILVSFDGHVKILDFGIAKAANQYEQTQKGILKGKVSYIAPEQILGKSVDSRADIFSLGAVFYELITGYKLFSGDNELEILRSITDGPIYPPSYFNDQVPEELEEIILKALSKEPDDRFPNAWEMQRALTKLLAQFDFHPTNTHLANFLKQLFEDEIEQESRYLKQKLEEVVGQKESERLEAAQTLGASFDVSTQRFRKEDIVEAFDEPSEGEDQDDVSFDLEAIVEDPAPRAKPSYFDEELPQIVVDPEPTKRLDDTRPDLELVSLTARESADTESPEDFAAPTPLPHEGASEKTDASIINPHVTGLHEAHIEADDSPEGASQPTQQEKAIPSPANYIEQHQEEFDESVSHILLTLRFRSKEYDVLRDLATHHGLTLEQLIHAMLQYSRPAFEAELDLKHSSS